MVCIFAYGQVGSGKTYHNGYTVRSQTERATHAWEQIFQISPSLSSPGWTFTLQASPPYIEEEKDVQSFGQASTKRLGPRLSCKWTSTNQQKPQTLKRKKKRNLGGKGGRKDKRSPPYASQSNTQRTQPSLVKNQTSPHPSRQVRARCIKLIPTPFTGHPCQSICHRVGLTKYMPEGEREGPAETVYGPHPIPYFPGARSRRVGGNLHDQFRVRLHVDVREA